MTLENPLMSAMLSELSKNITMLFLLFATVIRIDVRFVQYVNSSIAKLGDHLK